MPTVHITGVRITGAVHAAEVRRYPEPVNVPW